MLERIIHIIAGKGDDHRALFRRNELRSLLGPKGKNLKILFYFTILAFFSVTFAQAGLKYLQTRMDNPYVNWLTFTSTFAVDSQYDAIRKTLNTYADNEQYTLDEADGFIRYGIRFIDQSGVPLVRVKGRTFAVPNNSDLLAKILEEENLVTLYAEGKTPSDWNTAQRKLGIIITEDLANKIGCDDLATVYGNHDDNRLVMQVIAVVKSLPDRTHFMSSYELLRDMEPAGDTEKEFITIPRDTLSFLAKVPDGKAFDEEDFDLISARFSEAGLVFLGNSTEQTTVQDCIYNQRLTLHFTEEFYDLERYFDLRDKIEDAINYAQPFAVVQNNASEIGTYSTSDDPFYAPGSSVNKFSSFTLHFSEIDSIRSFRESFMNDFDVDINLEQIESRENFHLVSIITSILAIALGLFTLVSIILFITNVLKSHLEKIKMNLGTFMAFGLSPDFLVNGYSRLINGILIVVSVAVFLIIVLVDATNLPYRVLTGLGMKLKPDFTQAFTSLSIWLFLLIFLILAVTWFNCRKLVKAVMQHYPSDLINNRVI